MACWQFAISLFGTRKLCGARRAGLAFDISAGFLDFSFPTAEGIRMHVNVETEKLEGRTSGGFRFQTGAHTPDARLSAESIAGWRRGTIEAAYAQYLGNSFDEFGGLDRTVN